MSSINSKENSMSTTFNPYSSVVSAALKNTNKEIIMMTITPHCTELQTSHTHGRNKSCWCFKAFYYCLLWDQTLSVLTFLDWRWVCILEKILSCGAVCVYRSTILAVLKILSSDTSENWWEVWSGDCVSSLCFPLKVNFLPLAGVRGHCAETQTHSLKHHDIHHRQNPKAERVRCTIRNSILSFPQLVLLVRAGCNQRHQRMKLLHPSWQWAGVKINLSFFFF